MGEGQGLVGTNLVRGASGGTSSSAARASRLSKSAGRNDVAGYRGRWGVIPGTYGVGSVDSGREETGVDGVCRGAGRSFFILMGVWVPAWTFLWCAVNVLSALGATWAVARGVGVVPVEGEWTSTSGW
jgi:hypothetical protein